jgi:putative inorganic carbon (hco3(-)) transporter
VKFDLAVTAVFIGLVLACFSRPHLLLLIYIWLDFIPYQQMSSGYFSQIPIALVLASLTMVSYCIYGRTVPNKFHFLHFALMVWGIWITATTTWAVAPEAAWNKWDWAFKTIAVAAFAPLVIRTRLHIEALILVMLCAIGANVFVAAFKTMLGGGGYNTLSMLLKRMMGLGESSTLAVVAVMILPLARFISLHSLIVGHRVLARLGYLTLLVLVPVCVVGTHARAGLLALLAWAGWAFLGLKHKLLTGSAAALCLYLSMPYLPSSWWARMGTIETHDTEASASARIAVWLWTIDFARANPFGGGFSSYLVNTVEYSIDPSQSRTLRGAGKAFHSIYFEILGEHGFPGIAIFALMVACFYTYAFRTYVAMRRSPENRWAADLSAAMALSMTVFLIGGAFIGVAFQPAHYLLFAVMIALRDIVGQERVKFAPAAVDGAAATKGLAFSPYVGPPATGGDR